MIKIRVIKVFENLTGKYINIFTLKSHILKVNCVKYSYDSLKLFSSSEDK